MELKSEREIGVKIFKEKSWKLDTQTEKTKELVLAVKSVIDSVCEESKREWEKTWGEREDYRELTNTHTERERERERKRKLIDLKLYEGKNIIKKFFDEWTWKFVLNGEKAFLGKKKCFVCKDLNREQTIIDHQEEKKPNGWKIVRTAC